MHPIVQEAGVWWLAAGPAQAEPTAEFPDLTSVLGIGVPSHGVTNNGSSAVHVTIVICSFEGWCLWCSDKVKLEPSLSETWKTDNIPVHSVRLVSADSGFPAKNRQEVRRGVS